LPLRQAAILASCSGVLRLTVVFAVLATIGCARVPAHRRDRLASPAMQTPVWSHLTTADEHVHTVREGTAGATGAGGGGCGCN